MFKRSMLSVALVATMACQPLLAVGEEFVPKLAADVTEVAPSFVTAAQQSILNGLSNVASVFSLNTHVATFAAINEARKNDGFKAACGAFFNNKATVVATGLTLAALTAAGYVAYTKFFAKTEKTN